MPPSSYPPILDAANHLRWRERHAPICQPGIAEPVGAAFPVHALRGSRQRKPRPDGWPELALAFLLPVLSFWEVRLLGRLMLSELAIVLALPCLWLNRRGPLGRRTRTTLVTGVLWLAFQIGTDVLRETPWVDYARGWAKIAVFLALLTFLATLTAGRPANLLAFGCGLYCGFGLKYFIAPAGLSLAPGATGFWKFGVGLPMTGMLVCLSCLKPLRACPPWSQGLLLLVAAALHLLFGYRSLALVTFATATLLALAWRLRCAQRRGRPSRPAAVLLIIGLGIMALWVAYQLALDTPYAGYSLREKHDIQSRGRFGLLLGGRSEVLIAVRAIGDSPLIGHGSWAKNRSYALMEVSQYGVERAEPDPDLGYLIPTHSHLLGAWVEAGVMGALFWARLLCLAFLCLTRLPKNADHLLPLAGFACLDLLWAIPFSPFSFSERLFRAFEVTVMLTQLHKPALALPGRLVSSPGRPRVRPVQPVLRPRYG